MSNDVDLLVLDSDETIVVEHTDTEVVQLDADELLVIAESDIELVAIAEQGPAGVTTVITEDEMPYAKRTDIVSDSLIYKGRAAPGSLPDAPVWQVWRMTIGTDGDVSEEWAEGSADFKFAWANRSQLTYI